MRFVTCLTGALALCAYSPVQSKATSPGAKAASFQLNETSWTYMDHGTKVRESIDADGNYVENAVSGKHMDHGTAVMKAGKACFTSAMTKEGEVCWTTSPVKIGHSMIATNDKGQKLKVTRATYVPMSMPK